MLSIPRRMNTHEDLIGNALVCRQRLQFLEGALVDGHIDIRAVFRYAFNEYIKEERSHAPSRCRR